MHLSLTAELGHYIAAVKKVGESTVVVLCVALSLSYKNDVIIWKECNKYSCMLLGMDGLSYLERLDRLDCFLWTEGGCWVTL